MIVFRPRTRETLRHERATVLQELGAQAAADPRADWAHNRAVAAELRRRAQTRSTGVNTGPPSLTTVPGEGRSTTRSKHGGDLTPAGVPAPVERSLYLQPKGGGESDGRQAQAQDQGLGVVMGKSVAGGNGTTDSPCKYCGTVGGHTADCPVIS